MKKFFTMVVVWGLILTMTSIAGAVDFDYSMGGRFYGYVSTIDGDRGFNSSPGVDAWDTILGATLREGNTWATIKFIADSWNQKIYHSFGIDNIAGSPLSLGFDSHDSGTTNLGQQFMGDLFNDFKADPLFNTCDMAGSFNLKYITDTFEIRGEADIYDADGSTYDYYDWSDIENDYKERYALGFIFKNDLGKYYIGGKYDPKYDDPSIIVGTDLQLTEALGLKIDFYSFKDGLGNRGEFTNAFWRAPKISSDGEASWSGRGGHQTLQTTITYNKFTGQLLYSQPEDDDLDDVYGAGLAYQFNKLTLGAKYFIVDDQVSYDKNRNPSITDDNFYDVYAMYDVGAWDLKFGVSNAQFAFGQDGDKNEGGNYYDKQATISDDPFFYVGVHFEF